MDSPTVRNLEMAWETGTPSKVGDFVVFPVSLPTLKSFPQPATHYFYLKPHDPKVPDGATPRSLFLVNVPFDSTEAHLKTLFSTQLGLPNGRIADVVFHDRDEQELEMVTVNPALSVPASALPSRKRKRDQALIEGLPPVDPTLPPVWDRKLHRPGTNAVLVFVDKTSMQAAISAVKQARKEKKKIFWGQGVEAKVPSLGSRRYTKHAELLRPNRATLVESVDSYMAAFNAHHIAKDRLLAQQRQAPDADGFVTVTRSSSKAGIRGVKHDAARDKLDQQKKKQEGLTDFYRFQGRERAKERAGQLIKKFQEDVEKVQKIRERKGKLRVRMNRNIVF